MGEMDVPIYILNGVQSNRWIKPVIENAYGNVGNNSFSCTADLCITGECPTNFCSTTGCPSITRAFYSLVDDGSVYLTTPDGLVFYLANNSDEMKLVFPINIEKKLSKNDLPIESTGFVSVEGGIGSGKIQVDMKPANYDIVVRPALSHVIPWRPGTTNCSISYGDNYKERRLQYATRKMMSFPYANGYYCVQTDYNRCVVFYKGELIYDGEFNGMGLPLTFSYGLMTCISYGMGCCPKVLNSSITWNYRIMPKWKTREKDNLLEYVTESAVDRFLATHTVLSCGTVVGSNIFKWNRGSAEFVPIDGYYADDSYQKVIVETEEEYEVIECDSAGMPVYENGEVKKTTKTKKVTKEQDVSDGFRRFDIYRITPDTKTGITPFPLCYFIVPTENGTYLKGQLILSENIEQAKNNDVFDDINALLASVLGIGSTRSEIIDGLKSILSNKNGIKTILEKIKNLDGFSSLLPKLSFANIKEFGQKLQQALDGMSEANEIINSLKEAAQRGQGEIAALSSELFNLVSALVYERDVRIWWSPVLGADSDDADSNDPEDKVYCGLNEEEKVSVPVYGSESDIVYRCDEQLHTKMCNAEFERGMPPSYLQWYAGKGYSEEDGSGVGLKNRTLWLSRWRNELCTYCEEGQNEDGTDKCKCTENPISAYSTNNNCKYKKDSFDSSQNGPGVCGRCNYPVDFGDEDEPCWRHAPDARADQNGKRHCERATVDEDGNPITEKGKLGYYCDAAVAKVSLDYLGGRVESIKYNTKTDSDWGFIRIGEPKCRIKKDYTVIGRIDSPLELPGITSVMVTTDEPEKDDECNIKLDDQGNVVYKKVKQYKTIDPSAANAVILRAPADVFGDFKNERSYGFAKGLAKTVKRYRKKQTEKVEIKRFYEVGYVAPKVGCKIVCNQILKDVGIKSISYSAGSTSNAVKTEAETETTFSTEGKTIYYKANASSEDTDLLQTYILTAANDCPYFSVAHGGGVNKGIDRNDPCYRRTTDDNNDSTKKREIPHKNEPLTYHCFRGEVVNGDVYVESLPESQDGENKEVVHTLSIPIQFQTIKIKYDPDHINDLEAPEIDYEEVYSKLVLYGTDTNGVDNAQTDFLFEFAGDWDFRTDLLNEKITINKEFKINESGSQDYGESSDVLVCTGIVTISHSYQLVSTDSSDDENDEDANKDTLYETHSDTYTIIRQLYHKTEKDSSTGNITDSYYVKEYPERTLTSRIVHGIELDDSALAELVEGGLGTLCEKLRAFIEAHQDKASLVSKFTGSILKVLKINDLCEAFGDDGEFNEEQTDTPVDPVEVRGKFMRFYPAYITHPDFVPVTNDGSRANLMRWTSSYSKERCFSDDKIPSTSSQRTCTKGKDSAEVGVYESFYNMDRYDSYFSGDGTVNRSPIPQMTSMNWSFMGIVNDLDILEEEIEEDKKNSKKTEENDSNEEEPTYTLPSEIRWYVKWHDNTSPDIDSYVLVPLPKPAGKCDTSRIYKRIKDNKILVYDDISIDKSEIKKNGTKTKEITQKDVGTWFCLGLFGNYSDALENYGGHEEVDDQASYTDICGVKWVQAVTCWGDENGLAIRGGTEVGDVYYKLGELNKKGDSNILETYSLITSSDGPIEQTDVEDINSELDQFDSSKTTFEELDPESDKYWYWNGFAWTEGKSYMSDLSAEEVIFYKNLGDLDISIEDSGEQQLTLDGKEVTAKWGKSQKRTMRGDSYDSCDTHLNCHDFSKAIYKGRVRNKQACGDVLAVNLNAGQEYHKAVFLRAKPIWDQPAYSATIYPDQIERLRCLGSGYTLLTYNVGKNKQMFRLWYRDYGEGESDGGTVSFAKEFSYDKVPDFGSAKDRKISLADIQKYGADKIAKTYLVLLSRDGTKMYLFYKGRLLKVYSAASYGHSSWENTYAVHIAGVHGPKYCAVWVDYFPSDRTVDNGSVWFTPSGISGVFDVFLNGSFEKNVEGRVGFSHSSNSVNGVWIETINETDQSYANELFYESVRLADLTSPNHSGMSNPLSCRLVQFGSRSFKLYDLSGARNGVKQVLSWGDYIVYVIGDGTMTQSDQEEPMCSIGGSSPQHTLIIKARFSTKYYLALYNKKTEDVSFQSMDIEFPFYSPGCFMGTFKSAGCYSCRYTTLAVYDSYPYTYTVNGKTYTLTEAYGHTLEGHQHFVYDVCNFIDWSKGVHTDGTTFPPKSSSGSNIDFYASFILGGSSTSKYPTSPYPLSSGFTGRFYGFVVFYPQSETLLWCPMPYKCGEDVGQTHCGVVGNPQSTTNCNYRGLPINITGSEILVTVARFCDPKDSDYQECVNAPKTVYSISKTGISTTDGVDFYESLACSNGAYPKYEYMSSLCDYDNVSCGGFFAYDTGKGRVGEQTGFYISGEFMGWPVHTMSEVGSYSADQIILYFHKCYRKYVVTYAGLNLIDSDGNPKYIEIESTTSVSASLEDAVETLENNCSTIRASAQDVFYACCLKSRVKTDWGTSISGGDYVILADGTAFYKTNQIFSLPKPFGLKAFGTTDVTEGENGAEKTSYSASIQCCGNGALFDYTIIHYTQKRNKQGVLQFEMNSEGEYRTDIAGNKIPVFTSTTERRQCLFIEGKPVYPFVSPSSDEPVWIKDRGFRLNCCGLDYYHLETGDFSDDIDDIWEDEAVLTEQTERSETYTLHLLRDGDDVGRRELANGDIATVDEIGTRVFTHTEQRTVMIGEEPEEIDVTIRRVLEYPKSWKVKEKNIVFLDDYNYEHAEAYPNADTSVMKWSILGALKEEQVRYVPWKHRTSMNGRESHVYYRTTHISADPRIQEVVCYRYENIHPNKETDECEEKRCSTHYSGWSYGDRKTFGEYHAIGAYAIFYDNPFYEAWSNVRSEEYSWTQKMESNQNVQDDAQVDDTAEYFNYHYFETPAVQNVLGVRYADKSGGYEHDASKRILCDVDHEYLVRDNFDDPTLPCGFKKLDGTTDDKGVPMETYDSAREMTSSSAVTNTPTGSLSNNKSTFTTMKGITKKAQRNVCMIVWSKEKCQSGSKFVKLKHNDNGSYEDVTATTESSNPHTGWYDKKFIDWHAEDRPYDEFWDGTADDGDLSECLNIPSGISRSKDWMARLRSDVIYINDYNAAGRWDRVSGDDPVDDWLGTSAGGFQSIGGYWTSAPEYHTVQDPDNMNLCPCGRDRLVVSGNNTLYVFDADGRTDYDVLTGRKRTYPVALEDVVEMPNEE